MKTENIRDSISRKRRRLFFLLIPSFLCFVGGMILAERTSWLLIVGFLGFCSMLALVFAMLFAIRCPNCGGNLGYAVAWPATWDYSVSPNVRFCPFCGISMDKDIQEIGSNQRIQPIAGKPGSG